jgi:integrase
MKYLQRYPDGSIWFRKGGRVLGRLPNDEGSDEFKREYDRLLATAAKSRRVGRPSAMSKPKTVKPTVGLFVERYRGSDFFADPSKPHLREKPLAPGTQYNYRAGLDLMHEQGITSLCFSDLTPHRANLYVQKIKRERGGAAAAQQKTLLSNLWQFARNFPDFDGGDRHNPMTGKEITQPYTVAQEHEPWPEDVQEDFLAACDENLYLAFHLLICTGQRVSDVAKMKRSQYDGTWITLTQQKDRAKTPMKIKAPKLLQKVIAKADARRGDETEYLLTHKWGRRYTRDSLGHRIKEVLKITGHERYTTHGLRKNAGIILAENGATVPQIMAALGHKTPKMALYYCRLANQKLLAEQAADILDLAFARRAEGRAARVDKRRASIKAVK